MIRGAAKSHRRMCPRQSQRLEGRISDRNIVFYYIPIEKACVENCVSILQSNLSLHAIIHLTWSNYL